MDSQSTSSSLLVRAQQNEATAWDRIVSLYSPLVYKWCLRWGLKPQDAENVGQEVFLSVARSLATFERRRNYSFRSWLRQITRNKYVDYLRGSTNTPRCIGGSDAQGLMVNVEDVSQTEEEISAERAALYRTAVELIRSEFSERDWNAFYSLTIEGTPAAEVATTLGVSVNIVYLVKSRILRRVRLEFRDLIDVPEEAKPL